MQILSNFSSFLDLIILSLLSVAFAAPHHEEAHDVEAAQFHFMNSPYKFNQFQPNMGQNKYGHQDQYPQDIPVFDNGPLNPGKYLDMDDDEFPVDYSLSCSNSCGCRQTCMIIWW